LIVASALLFEWGPLWQAWRGPLAMRPVGTWLTEAPAPLEPLQRVGLQSAGLVSQFLLAVLVAYAVPRHVRRIADSLTRGSWAAARFLAIGALLAVGLTVMGLLAALSEHTFPLTFVLAVAFFLAAVAGVVALAYQVGRVLLARAGWAARSPLAGLALGTLILYALTRVPYFGLVVLIVLSLTGAGAALSTRFGSRERWSLSPLVEESTP
jgi:hypothetical protein